MNNGLTLEGLIQLQEEQGMSDEKFYEMVTDKVCEDPSIEKGLLEYEDIYKVIKNMIKKVKSNNPTKKTYPNYLRLIK